MDAESASNVVGWAHSCSFLSVLKLLWFRAILSAVIAFAISLCFGPRVIRKLISLKVGQPIRTADEVHQLAELHGGKIGTPTMGGVLIVSVVVASTLLSVELQNPLVWICLFVMTACAVLGFCDDYKKVKEKNSSGLSSRKKMAWQLLISLVAAGLLFAHSSGSAFVLGGNKLLGAGSVFCPIGNFALLDLGIWIIPFFILVIVGCSNAVNLTDGLDGLAAGCTVSAAATYAVLAFIAGDYLFSTEFVNVPYHLDVGEVAVFLMALVGACFGFLWFNCHPAKVFMGDTGSLAIGGALATAAIAMKQELLLVMVGGVFVMEAMSVILQVASFKLRKKRIFKMSPIHHHFELLGWHENQVINRFWMLSIGLAVLSLLIIKLG
jgi:phospho-N-acetylmuramoyl-pentapeptide-transferase